jgi:toxin ParE1/3/4
MRVLFNPARAVSFVRQLKALCLQLGDNPLRYRLRPEIGPAVRLVAMGHYVILYRIVGEAVRVERVVHGARDLPALLDDDQP